LSSGMACNNTCTWDAERPLRQDCIRARIKPMLIGAITEALPLHPSALLTRRFSLCSFERTKALPCNCKCIPSFIADPHCEGLLRPS
jgi:hypothetical protein